MNNAMEKVEVSACCWCMQTMCVCSQVIFIHFVLLSLIYRHFQNKWQKWKLVIQQVMARYGVTVTVVVFVARQWCCVLHYGIV